MAQIYNAASGAQYGMKIDANQRAHVQSVMETESQHATEVGQGYNINTGKIALTTSTASGVLYFKNNETQDMIVEKLIFGIGSAGTTTDMSEVTIIKNPTTGTLISGATAVDINENRNFGSSLTLSDSLAYKGAEGNTVTDGTDTLYIFAPPGSRQVITIDLTLTKGDSMGVTIDSNTSSGTTNVYCALVCHLKDEAAKD